MRISRSEFSPLYLQCVREVSARLPADWSALARHNAGWRRARFDAGAYLVTSEVRYWHAARFLAGAGARHVLDVGGFLGAFPLALKRLGFDVAIAEKYGYYGDAMRDIVTLLSENGVEVIDTDFSEPAAKEAVPGAGFDGVTCMAVAEHLAHSPRALMENIERAIGPGGALVFEVPNIAYWPKRFVFFFRGETVHAPIDELYHSAVPFTGHHREYTRHDARYVVSQAGFRIVEERSFNYTVNARQPLQFLKYLPAFLFEEWAEVIMLGCRKPQ
jgi:2-polyprenyl-3-methyl-5-hydroxy-6-metoxy-1,4-benzoquinol methylase